MIIISQFLEQITKNYVIKNILHLFFDKVAKCQKGYKMSFIDEIFVLDDIFSLEQKAEKKFGIPIGTGILHYCTTYSSLF